MAAVRYSGDGFWNLRDEFPASPPNFTQSTGSGYGVDLETSMRWDLHQTWHMSLGISYLQLNVRNGRDRIFFANGDIVDTDLHSARTTRTGIHLRVGKFF